MQTKIIFLLSLLSIISCRSNKSQSELQKHNQSTVVSYIDSTEASKAIIIDDVDGFFDQISIMDISIQMRQAEGFDNRDQALSAYKAYLRTEVMNWEESEKNMLTAIFDTIKTEIDAINPKLFPDEVRLIKVRTNHYGPDVYYTRGHNIMIPENALKNPNAKEMLGSVMTHEIFHLISRYDVPLREKIYALIGYFPHNRDLTISKGIADRLLTNPDGVSTNYYIELRDDMLTAKAIPIIMSNKSKYVTSSPTFFSYLQFEVFEMVEGENNTATLVHGDNLSTTLTDGMIPGFFEQIKDNTQYIIHPDEIAADNFIYAVNEKDVLNNRQFSQEGAQLVSDIQKILLSWKK